MDLSKTDPDFSTNLASYLSTQNIHYASKVIRFKAIFGIYWEWGIIYLTDQNLIFVPKNLKKQRFIIFDKSQDFSFSSKYTILKIKGMDQITGKKRVINISYAWDNVLSDWDPKNDSRPALKSFPAIEQYSSVSGLLFTAAYTVRVGGKVAKDLGNASGGLVETAGAVGLGAATLKGSFDSDRRSKILSKAISNVWHIDQSK